MWQKAICTTTVGSISKQLVKVNLTKYISAKRRFVEQKTKLCTEKKPVKQSNGIRSQKKLPGMTSQIQ